MQEGKTPALGPDSEVLPDCFEARIAAKMLEQVEGDPGHGLMAQAGGRHHEFDLGRRQVAEHEVLEQLRLERLQMLGQRYLRDLRREATVDIRQ